jgi:hypothetical protein
MVVVANAAVPMDGIISKFYLTISGIFSILHGGNSLLGNFLRRNEAPLLWTKLIKPVINNP